MSSSTNCDNSNPNTLRPWPLLRGLLAIALVGFLLSRAPLSEIAASFLSAATSPRRVSAALLLVGLALLAGAARWHLLLSAQGVPLRLRETVRYFFYGQFFNTFFPGGCGGDLVRLFLVVRRSPHRKTAAAGTVVLDRLLGLYFYVAAVCVLLGIYELVPVPGLPRGAVVFTAAVILALSLAAVVLPLARPARLRSWLARAGGKSPRRLVRLLYALADSAALYLDKPGAVLGALFLSLLNFALLAGACLSFAHALRLAADQALIVAVFSAATLIGAVPLTPGALGVRETGYVLLLQSAGVSAAGALSLALLMYLAGVLWGLPGAAAFVFYARQSPRALLREARRTLSPRSPDEFSVPGSSA